MRAGQRSSTESNVVVAGSTASPQPSYHPSMRWPFMAASVAVLAAAIGISLLVPSRPVCPEATALYAAASYVDSRGERIFICRDAGPLLFGRPFAATSDDRVGLRVAAVAAGLLVAGGLVVASQRRRFPVPTL